MYVVFAGIAYLVYKDAEPRGMNALFWALFVFLFPFLGIIAYFGKRWSDKKFWHGRLR
ncbi:MAG TPA: PLDc N-terminal domain-containing protein [Methanothrix sp.]|nr:PLDc N-terminal domain-containing protein [Methanothrix sp.]HRW82028.1 PLDc N-terminal domain-containing protein [Methanothrix sp.]